jgi:hypothetical protein
MWVFLPKTKRDSTRLVPLNHYTLPDRLAYDTSVKQASILVGRYPDECTEDILDTALLYGKPVAIVPCCVFPQMFPDRYLAGRPHIPVTTYEEFLRYLLEKDDRLQRATLPFEGRNQVIYGTTFK